MPENNELMMNSETTNLIEVPVTTPATPIVAEGSGKKNGLIIAGTAFGSAVVGGFITFVVPKLWERYKRYKAKRYAKQEVAAREATTEAAKEDGEEFIDDDEG